LDPEPVLRPQVEAVRAVVARLGTKPSGRAGRDVAMP
jgi:hypothetical protein